MLIEKIENKFLINFILSLICLTIPFVEFIKQNLKDYNTQVFTTIITIYILLLIFGIILSLCVKYLCKTKFTDTLFLYVVSTFLFFRWNDFNFLLKKLSVANFTYISLLIIIFIIIILSFLLVFKKKEKVNRLLVTFFIIYLMSLLINIFYKNLELHDVSLSSQQNNNKEKVITYLKKNKSKNDNRENIYYIILDGAISLERFEEIYGTSTDILKSRLNLKEFNYVKMNSSYFDTGLTVGSIFNLDYVSENLQNHKKNFAPNMLTKENLKYNKPNLIKILEDNEYKFVWYSNSIHDCNIINKSICGKTNKSFFNSYINSYVAINFLSSSPIISIMQKINFKFVYNVYYEHNDALNNFLLNSQTLNKDELNFFFIHSMMPHEPFFYDESCNFINNQKKMTSGYRMNYLCSLKRVKEFQDYIISNDKNAIVIIQGDHGYFFKDKKILDLRNEKGDYVQWMYENEQKKLLKNYSTFNLIKDDKCKLPKDVEFDNVNSIIFAVNCALNLDLEYKKKRTFFTFEKEIQISNN